MLFVLLICNSGDAGTALAWKLYTQGDVFSLNDLLAHESGGRTPRQAYLRAFVLAAFGKESASATILDGLVSASDKASARRARMLLMLDERALFHYRAALQAIAPLLSDQTDAQLANRARFLESIADVPPETVRLGQAISLPAPAIDAEIGNGRFHLLIDTGASFSVLSRSAARRAGLRVRVVQYEIESADGGKLRADVAVGDLAIAGTHLDNVVFLVLPDAVLPHSPPFSGAVGLPVLRLLGPLIFSGNANNSRHSAAPLAFVQGNPVVEVNLRNIRMLCRLDTGTNRSWFTASSKGPFARSGGAHRFPVIETVAGSARTIAAYERPLMFLLAGHAVVLRRALVVTPSSSVRNDSACTLGADAIAALAPVALDFDRMSIALP